MQVCAIERALYSDIYVPINERQVYPVSYLSHSCRNGQG